MTFTPKYMGNPSGSSYEELWKERVAFTSGSILLWGYFLLQLWPFAANFQTSRSMHFWTLFQEQILESGVVAEDQLYIVITFLLTLGLWTVILAVFHILFRGLRLMRPSEEDATSTTNRALGVLADASYVYLFVLTAIAISFVIVIGAFYSALIVMQSVLTRSLHLSAKPSYYVAIAIMTIVMMLIIVFTVLRVMGKDPQKKLQAIYTWFEPKRSKVKWAYLFFLLFLLSGYLVVEMTYTVELSTNKIVAYKTQDKAVEVSVRLGGSTSSQKEVKLALLGADQGVVRELTLQNLGKGAYVVQVDLAGLTVGIYEVRLEYPHPSLSATSPFLQGVTRRSQKFVLAD